MAYEERFRKKSTGGGGDGSHQKRLSCYLNGLKEGGGNEKSSINWRWQWWQQQEVVVLADGLQESGRRRKKKNNQPVAVMAAT